MVSRGSFCTVATTVASRFSRPARAMITLPRNVRPMPSHPFRVILRRRIRGVANATKNTSVSTSTTDAAMEV